jgi:uncharacterized protein YciI
MKLLCIVALTLAAFAQESQQHFLVQIELAPGIDVTRLSPAQGALFQQHGERLAKLRDQGVVVTAGHTDNLKHIVAVIIVKAKDMAAAQALAAEDPAVKAGLLAKPTVEPFTLAVPPK